MSQASGGEVRRATTEAKTEADTVIELRHVHHRFGLVPILTDISLDIRRGTIAVVIGGSGTGKTTLLRIMVGLQRPTSGQVCIQKACLNDMNARTLREARSQLGMVFQYSALLDSLNVQDNVALPLREHSQLGPEEIEHRVREMLSLVELERVEQHFPSELSGGMRKRVALARALIRNPSIVLYDEPTSGLDPITARHVDELILRTRDQFGVTSVVISHDMAEATKVADQLFLLEHGRLVEEGSAAELLRRPGSLAARFLEASRPQL